MKISIFLINYNNVKLLKRSINSVLRQKYKNIEVLVFDDCSKDGSQKIIRGFKKITKIFNKNKIKSGCQSQINGIKKCLQISKGELVCFLDSDDFFDKNKIKTISDFFQKNPKIQIATDKPIFYYNKTKLKQSDENLNSDRIFTWPKFSPHSCIAVRKSFLKENFNLISSKRFDNVWLDFRILILSYLKFGKVYLVNNHFTFYQQKKDSVSSGFKKFGKIWWLRRMEAHNFIFYLKKKLNIKKNIFYFDYLLTKFIYILIK